MPENPINPFLIHIEATDPITGQNTPIAKREIPHDAIANMPYFAPGILRLTTAANATHNNNNNLYVRIPTMQTPRQPSEQQPHAANVYFAYIQQPDVYTVRNAIEHTLANDPDVRPTSAEAMVKTLCAIADETLDQELLLITRLVVTTNFDVLPHTQYQIINHELACKDALLANPAHFLTANRDASRQNTPRSPTALSRTSSSAATSSSSSATTTATTPRLQNNHNQYHDTEVRHAIDISIATQFIKINANTQFRHTQNSPRHPQYRNWLQDRIHTPNPIFAYNPHTIRTTPTTTLNDKIHKCIMPTSNTLVEIVTESNIQNHHHHHHHQTTMTTNQTSTQLAEVAEIADETQQQPQQQQPTWYCVLAGPSLARILATRPIAPVAIYDDIPETKTILDIYPIAPSHENANRITIQNAIRALVAKCKKVDPHTTVFHPFNENPPVTSIYYTAPHQARQIVFRFHHNPSQTTTNLLLSFPTDPDAIAYDPCSHKLYALPRAVHAWSSATIVHNYINPDENNIDTIVRYMMQGFAFYSDESTKQEWAALTKNIDKIVNQCKAALPIPPPQNTTTTTTTANDDENTATATNNNDDAIQRLVAQTIRAQLQAAEAQHQHTLPVSTIREKWHTLAQDSDTLENRRQLISSSNNNNNNSTANASNRSPAHAHQRTSSNTSTSSTASSSSTAANMATQLACVYAGVFYTADEYTATRAEDTTHAETSIHERLFDNEFPYLAMPYPIEKTC